MKDNVAHVHIHKLEMKWLTEGSTSVFCCFGLEVNADKTKYMVMSQDQKVRCSCNIRMDNSSFVRVEEFKYLGTNLTDQNSIQEEIKSTLKSENDSYHSVKNLLSFSLLSSNLMIKIYTEL
jgi:hypothetical protein